MQCSVKLWKQFFVTFAAAFRKDLILAKNPVRNLKKKKKYTNCCFYFNNEMIHFACSEMVSLPCFTVFGNTCNMKKTQKNL